MYKFWLEQWKAQTMDIKKQVESENVELKDGERDV